MLKNELSKYKLIRYKPVQHTLSVLYPCALLSTLIVLCVSVVHANSRCADLVSPSSPKEQSVPTSKEQSAQTDFGFDSESTSRGKNTLPLPSSSSKNVIESSSTGSFLGPSSNNTLDFYANSKVPKEGTKNFQSYIGELLEKQIIGDPELIQFIENLEKGKLINPISKSEALTSTPLLVQRRGLQKYLNKSSLDQKELLDWSRATLEKRARVRVKREEVQEETRDLYQRLEFRPVKRPVHFELRETSVRETVTLTYPIEVQSTPVTQKQWVEIMGENPSHFAEGENSVVLNFHGKDIELQPDNPVENITWWSILVFANRLSEQHGLPPVYDLSGIDWKPGKRAENGTLRPVKDSMLDKIRVYAKGGSHDPYGGDIVDIYYQTEGYRLPTLAEQAYMLQGGNNSVIKNESDEKKYAWYEGNSDDRTHPVGLLQAMVIDGKDFYDLYGNVREWGWGGSLGQRYYRRENPGPREPETGSRWAVGGSFHSYFRYRSLLSGFDSSPYPTRRESELGFRLVRTIEPGDGE